MLYLFESFELDERSFSLSQDGRRIPLEPKSLRVLLLLVTSDGRLLEKNEIIETVWKDTFVEETTLTRAIALIRKQLGDDPRNPRFIETVPTLGYRFIAKVETRSYGEPSPPQAEDTAPAYPQAQSDLPSLPVALPSGPGVRLASEGEVAKVAPSQTKLAAKRVYYAAAVVLLVAVAVALFLQRSRPASPPNSGEWEQLTFFTDSAVYPALSPDGRTLAFIRGSNSFIGPGQIYVKLLPGGEPVQLTHDSTTKLAPSFSPDSSRIAYSIVDPWDTWEVPVLGGAPHLLLPNSSSLSWIEDGKRLLFSEIREGLHLILVTTDEGRGASRDVYVPPGMRGMVHHSYLSPDGRWVLLVEMDAQARILPCRVVPFQSNGNPAASDVKIVGPPDRSCLSGAWSPDGKWIYLSVNTDVGTISVVRAGFQLGPGSHIWRQRFPDGQPEQITFGPTSQEGIAMAPDGKSFITSVGSQDHTVWMHDKDGDHQISSEGTGASPSFSNDGRSLYFLMANGQTRGEELWVRDLASGRQERVLPNYPMQNYSVSRDGQQVAFTMNDQTGHSSIWVAPTSRRSSPRHIASAVAEDFPLFLPDGDLVFRAVEGGSNFLYRMKIDGSARRKISPERILDLYDVSPDGRWVAAGTPGSDEENLPAGTRLFAVDGTTAVTLCAAYCLPNWDTSGRFLYLNFPELGEASYTLPIAPDSELPKIPSPGPARIQDFPDQKAITTIPAHVESAVSPSVYAYTRETTRRNLYRIPLR